MGYVLILTESDLYTRLLAHDAEKMSLQFSRNELRAERVEGKKEKYFYKL